jgi:hypothetical protein
MISRARTLPGVVRAVLPRAPQRSMAALQAPLEPPAPSYCERLADRDDSLSNHSVAVMMHQLSRQGSQGKNDALTMLASFRKSGRLPDCGVYREGIFACRALGKSSQAMDILRELQQHPQVSPDTLIYKAVLLPDGCARLHDLQQQQHGQPPHHHGHQKAGSPFTDLSSKEPSQQRGADTTKPTLTAPYLDWDLALSLLDEADADPRVAVDAQVRPLLFALNCLPSTLTRPCRRADGARRASSVR